MTSMLSAVLAAEPHFDHLFDNGVDGWVVLIVLVKTVAAFTIALLSVIFMIWFMRKLIADMQNRLGPERAGPFGILQTLADGIKFIFKEGFMPENADRRVYKLAPFLAMVPAFMTFAIVPIGGELHFGSYHTRMQLADPPMGILWLLAMSSIAVYGVMLAGWASGSKYPLLGAVRASAQMVSYEAALGLSIAAVVLYSGSLGVGHIVDVQAASGPGNIIPNWHVISLGFVPFLTFLVAATAELNQPPFDLVEAEQELVGGFNTEYASFAFAMFYLAEFMNVVIMSAIMVTLFFGGPAGPVPHVPVLNWLVPVFWFALKEFCFLYLYVWIRATVPRFRYDQLMDLGWKKLIPVSLGWLLILAGFRSGNRWWGVAMLGVVVVAGLVLYRAVQVGKANSTLEAAEADAIRRARSGRRG